MAIQRLVKILSLNRQDSAIMKAMVVPAVKTRDIIAMFRSESVFVGGAKSSVS